MQYTLWYVGLVQVVWDNQALQTLTTDWILNFMAQNLPQLAQAPAHTAIPASNDASTNVYPLTKPGKEIGALLGVYGKSRSFLFVWGFLALLFGSAGFFVLSLIPKIGTTLRFNGNVSMVYVVGLGCLIVALGIAIVAWRLTASQPTFYLYENAIRAKGPQFDRTDFYHDLEDLFTFFYGGMAYRASSHAPWTFIGSRIHRFGELSQRLRAMHVEKRGERLYTELMAGKSVFFHCLPDEVALSKSFFASRNMNHRTFKIELTATHLKLKNKQIEVQHIGDIIHNAWTERSRILDHEGKVFHAMHPTAIMSFDVLYALINHLNDTSSDSA